jgi:hypothetical protein
VGVTFNEVRADNMNTSTHTPLVTARPLLGECAMSRTMATVRGEVEHNIMQGTVMLYQNQRPTWRSVVAVIAVAGATGVLYV